MYILVAISILCLFVLVLAAVIITRHVRNRRPSAGPPKTDFAEYLFAAANDQDVIAKTSSNRALEPTLADTRDQSISSKRF